MPSLPQTILPTITKIYEQYVINNGDWRRPHLGASLIGGDCERSLWYTFRWCSDPKFSGRMLRLFDTGFSQEARIIKDLRKIGCEVYDTDPNTGRQINYSEFGGHYSGSLDAVAKGFEESSVFHVIEIKTMNTKGFGALQRDGVKATKPEHYAQMQAYLLWSGLERAYYFCVCKEDDSIYGERIYYDKEFAEKLTDKAYRIIFADSPLEKNESYKCKFCTHRAVCLEKQLPEINCRTCAFSDVIDDGKWKCVRYEKEIDSVTQRNGCPAHVFIPAFVGEPTDASETEWTISYGTVTNGLGYVSSKEMKCQTGR